MTQAQALYDFRYNKVKLACKLKVKTAYGPPRCPESWDSRHIGCLVIVLLHVMHESALKRFSEWRNQGYVTTNTSTQ